MGTNSSKAERSQTLPQYVGFSHVQEALGVSRRTVERMVRDGQFPQPVQLSPNRVGWRVETVTEWMSERKRGLTAKAVTRPEDLSPDEFELTIRTLAAGFLTKESGRVVSPSELSIGIGSITFDDEAMDLGPGLVEHFDGAFDHFEVSRAIIATARLFQALVPWLTECAVGPARDVFSDSATLREFGDAALVDEVWVDRKADIERRMGRPEASELFSKI